MAKKKVRKLLEMGYKVGEYISNAKQSSKDDDDIAPVKKTATTSGSPTLLNAASNATLIASGILGNFREKRNDKKQEREYEYINKYVNGTKAKVGMEFNGGTLTEKVLKKTPFVRL